MARFNNTFEFIGELSLPKDATKFHEVTYGKDNANWQMDRISFAVKESKTNSVFVELSSGHDKNGKGKILTYGKGLHGEKGSKLEITWDDRMKESSVDMVADFKKIVVDLETDFETKDKYMEIYYKIRSLERKENPTEEDKQKLKTYKEEFKGLAKNRCEFISEFDAIEYLANMLPTLLTHKFRITGQIQMSEWKGKYYTKYILEHIEIVKSDTPNRLKANVDLYFDKDSMDNSDFAEEKKIYISGYLQNYDRRAKEDRFYAHQFIINATKLNMEDENHMKFLQLLISQFKPTNDNFWHMIWEANIYRGAEKKDFTYEDLTPNQRIMVDVGRKTVQDFAPNGGMFGDNIDEFRLVEAKFEGDFAEGSVDAELTVEEFIEKVAKNTEDINYKDITKNDKKEEGEQPKETEPPKVDFNSLFG